MTNNNVIAMNRPINDMDVMVNLCNTPRQQQRRQAKRIKHRRSMRTRMMALHASLVSAGVGMGLMAGILIF
jgi:phage tail tape-measure protein